MNDADFGKVLRKMRMDSGKTVPEVSEHLTSLGYKAATQTIYGWERGLSQPNPDPFLEMCIFYGVTDILSYFGNDPIDTKKSTGHKEKPPAQGGEPIGPNKRALLDLVDSMSEDEMAALLELVKAAKKMRGKK